MGKLKANGRDPRPPLREPSSTPRTSGTRRARSVLAGIAIVTALLSLVVPGELLALIGTIIVPAASALSASRRLSAVEAAGRGAIAALWYAGPRAAVDLYMFYFLGWRQALQPGHGADPGGVSALSIVFVVASMAGLALARVLAGAIVGSGIAFALRATVTGRVAKRSGGGSRR